MNSDMNSRIGTCGGVIVGGLIVGVQQTTSCSSVLQLESCTYCK